MKKIFSVILALTLIFAVMPMAVHVNAYTEGLFTYSVSNNEATLTGVSYNASGKVTVPSYLGGYKVTAVATNAFNFNSNITEVVFPDTITTFENTVLYACKGLVSVKMPANLTTMGNSTFWNCTSLTDVQFGNKLTTVGNDTFKGCTSLTEVTLPDSITYIGGSTFLNCTALTKVNYPDTMTILSYSTFQGCTSLEEFSIPNSITEIGENAFYGCTSLTDISFSENLKSVYSGAFRNCTSLTAITIPDSTAELKNGAFRGCTALTDVYFGTGLATIDEYTFYGCSSLTKIHLASFGEWCEIDFENRYALPSYNNNSVQLYVDGSVAKTSIPEGTQKIGTYALYGSSITTVNIPASVKSIENSAFRDSENLVMVTGGSGLEYIADHAFYNCTALKTATFSEGATTLGDYAFSNCSSLVSVTLPDTLESIGEYAFSSCSALKTLTLGKNIKSIGQYAFYSANELELVKVPSLETWLSINFPVIESNPLWNGAALYINNAIPTVLDIPEGITEIKKYALYGCSSIIELNLSSTVTSIGDEAFYNCDNLQKVNAKNVKTIGNSAFKNCYYLTTLTFEDGLETVGKFAFNSCSKLTAAPLPDSVVTIDDYAFYGASSLKEVHFGENLTTIGEGVFPNSIETVKAASLEHWLSLSFKGSDSNPLYGGAELYFGDQKVTSVTIPDGVELIGDYAFYGCQSVEFIKLSDTVSVVGKDAFKNCTNLKEAVLGDGIFAIDDWMFSGCSSLTEIHIPKTVFSVGQYAFYDCKNLETVTYSGSESESETLKILTEDTNNDYLLEATWEYNVCYHAYSGEEDYSCNKCYESLTPPAPTTEKVRYNTVTLKYVEGLEYSLDGVTWQDSNVFTGLNENTEYTFYQRVKETDTSKVSEASEKLTVATPVKPPYIIYDCNDDGDINTIDLAVLKLHLAGSGIVGDGADCNEDGNINTSDLAALKIYLSTN